jgi:septum formation protein
VLLASTSPYRRALLSRLGIPFECIAPDTDETPQPRERADALVSRLARAKAHSVGVRHPDAWIIGSDQAAVLGEGDTETILGKPGTIERGREQLAACSGRTVRYLTAVCLRREHPQVQLEFVDVTRVRYRALEMPEIERYLERDRPTDCAGGMRSEGLGVALCESIESSDPTALIGLPLIRLTALLREAGFELP